MPLGVTFNYSDISGTSSETSQQSGFAWERASREHEWFTRDWTLQKPLAPALVEFFTLGSPGD
jgi:hypothetical protein